MSATLYSSRWYGVQHVGSAQSADVLVPMLLAQFPARSVIDVGCGIGAWLAAFGRNGVGDLTGFDGDYVRRDALLIPPECFHPHDLKTPLNCEGRADLALSLEVAEHLPTELAPQFVAELTRLSDTIVFSAAIPGQGGRGHINEQWPAYWAELFAEHGYRCLDPIRARVWNDPRVEYWYAQNLVVYVSATRLAQCPELTPVEVPPGFVHPELYVQWLRREGVVSKLKRVVYETLVRSGLR